MRWSGILMAAAALMATACAEQAEETADDIAPPDTVVIDAGEVATDPVGVDAPSAVDAPPASDGADTPDAPADDPADDTDDSVATSIPSRFHGEWNAELTACGTGSSETRLRISAEQLRFYESAGAVIDVDILTERVITVTARYQGEGDTWEDERRLSLSADGNSLTVSNGTDLVRYRCP